MAPTVPSSPLVLSQNAHSIRDHDADHDYHGHGDLASDQNHHQCHDHSHDHGHGHGHNHDDIKSHGVHQCAGHSHDHEDAHQAHGGTCGHSHEGCGHSHTGWKQYAPHGHSLHTRLAADKRALSIALLILALSFTIQLTGAVIASSSMLFVESLHSLVDGLTVVLSLISTVIAAYPPTARMSYGYGRAEVLSALLSLVALGMLCIKLGIRAVSRVYATLIGQSSDTAVNGRVVVLAEAITLAANIGMAIVLSKGATSSLNIRAVRAHVIADSLENFVVLVAGAVIWAFPSAGLIDPVLTVVVVFMLITLNFRIAQETVEVVMQAAPVGVVDDAQKSMREIEDIVNVDSLNVWTVTTGVVVASVRVSVTTTANLWDVERVRKEVTDALRNAGIQDTCVEVIVSSSSTYNHSGDNSEGSTISFAGVQQERNNDSEATVSLIDVETKKGLSR